MFILFIIILYSIMLAHYSEIFAYITHKQYNSKNDTIIPAWWMSAPLSVSINTSPVQTLCVQPVLYIDIIV